jgi:chromosome segregation ATPase
MNLNDFRSDISNFDSREENLKDSESQVSALIYHEELNTLKIDKLSNRVTIISIIIPCLIGAILIFGYLDMKERLVDVDVTKQSQVDRISQQLEDKLNALDVKIARNRFDLENNLPEFDKKTTSLEKQIVKIASSKVDTETINTRFEKLEKQVANNANQNKITMETIERINKLTLSTFKNNTSQFDKIALQIKEETALLKQEFNDRLNELPDSDQELGELRKNFSLMDKKYKNLENESASQSAVDKQMTQLENGLNNRLNTIDSLITTLNQKLEVNISRLQKEINRMSNKATKNTKPKPQINIDSSKPATIKEKSLTQ